MLKRFGYEVMIILAIFAVFYSIQALDWHGVKSMPDGEALQVMVPPEAVPTLNIVTAPTQGVSSTATAQEVSSTATAQEVSSTTAAPLTPGLVLGGIDINQADAETLARLKGIGPVLAQRIVAYREAQGPFNRVEDLEAVKGIGPKLLEKIRQGQLDPPASP